MKCYVYLYVLLFAATITARSDSRIGKPNSSIRSELSKIWNGYPAEESQYPYMARIVGAFHCGGVLISPSWVLTEAFCIVADYATVYLGSVHVNTPLLMIVSRDLRPHPLFDFESFVNNIGLINLMHSVMYGETIGPIALPRESQAYPDFAAEKTATIIGWGQFENNGGLSEILRYGNVEVISTEVCQTYYTRPLFDTNTCVVPTGEIQQNACGGDWGGPLVLNDVDDNIDIVAGLFSDTIINYCFSGEPTIFIRPQYYWDWINNHTGIPIRP